MRQFATTLIFLAMTAPVFAAGSDDPAPPKPTQTTTECKKGEVFDTKTKACIPAKSSSLNDDQRYDAVRELAYANRLDEATDVLAAMTEGETDRVLTYRGFIARKMGDWPTSERFYLAAIAANPDNLLVRSYYGQGLAERGNRLAAAEQLVEIRVRGGAGGWAEAALEQTLRTGIGYSY